MIMINYIKNWLKRRKEKSDLNKLSEKVYKDTNRGLIDNETLEESKLLEASIETSISMLSKKAQKKREKDRKRLEKLNQFNSDSIKNMF